MAYLASLLAPSCVAAVSVPYGAGSGGGGRPERRPQYEYRGGLSLSFTAAPSLVNASHNSKHDVRILDI